MKREFTDVQVGDTIICYDEHLHDYEQHRFQVTSIEYHEEYVTETNPKGMVLFGDDLDYSDDEEAYIGLVHEGNFVMFTE